MARTSETDHSCVLLGGQNGSDGHVVTTIQPQTTAQITYKPGTKRRWNVLIPPQFRVAIFPTTTFHRFICLAVRLALHRYILDAIA
jgi:hypothetical protein